MNFGRIKYDVLFKKVFEKPHILKAFLNTVLENELDSPIKIVELGKTDFIIKGKPILVQETKHDTIDIFCTTEKDTRILVELQKGDNKKHLLRFLDYQCRNYSSQFKTGDDYTETIPCYSICWLFDMKPPHEDIKEIIKLQSNKKKTDWRFNWEIVALYPRNIKKEHIETDKLNKLEEWLILDVAVNIKKAINIKKLIHTEEVEEAFENLDLSGLTDEQVRILNYEEGFKKEYRDIIEKEIEKSEKEGKKEGKKEGEKQKAIQIAKNLLDVLDIETISLKTGLTEQEIKNLK